MSIIIHRWTIVEVLINYYLLL